MKQMKTVGICALWLFVTGSMVSVAIAGANQNELKEACQRGCDFSYQECLNTRWSSNFLEQLAAEFKCNANQIKCYERCEAFYSEQ